MFFYLWFPYPTSTSTFTPCQGPKQTFVHLGLAYIFYLLITSFIYSFHLAPPPSPPKDTSHNASTSHLPPLLCITMTWPPGPSPWPWQDDDLHLHHVRGPNECVNIHLGLRYVFFFYKKGEGAKQHSIVWA